MSSTSTKGDASGPPPGVCRADASPPPPRSRSLRRWLLDAKRAARAHPMVLLTPLIVLAALVALGVVGVIILAEAIKEQRKDDAVNEALARSIIIQEKFNMAVLPVHGLANFVLNTPGYFWPVIKLGFDSQAQALGDLLAGSGLDMKQFAMSPAAIVSVILPYEPNVASMYKDLLSDPDQRNLSLTAIHNQKLILAGPYMLKQGYLGAAVRLPVFVNGSTYGPNSTFGLPPSPIPPYRNTPYDCPDCYGERRFWGFCSSLLDWRDMRKATKVDDLHRKSGYRFQLTRQPQGTESGDFLLAGSPNVSNQTCNQTFNPLGGCDPVEVSFQVLTSEWKLRLCREGGWFPSWRAPMIAVVVVVSLVLSLLIGMVMGWNCRLMNTGARLQATAIKLQEEREQMDALLVRQYELIHCFAQDDEQRGSSDTDTLGLKINQLRHGLHTNSHNSLKSLEGDRIELHELLGSGNFGKVYRGTWRGTTVAVKCIVLPSNMSRSAHAERMALMETAISSSMHHPHLVQTYTYSIKPIKDSSAMAVHGDLLHMEPASMCEASAVASAAGSDTLDGDCRRASETTSGAMAAGSGALMAAGSGLGAPRASGECSSEDVHSFEIQLVLEYCDGSLDEFLKQSGFLNGSGLNFGGILDTAADVAKGMLHLHMNEILHSDLKAGNVMFKAGGHDGRGVIAKVVDFGLSIQLDVSGNQTHVSKMFQGTLTHMAPEVLLLGKQSKAADVYAFGILMFELYTGTEPYAGIPAALLGHHVAREGRRPHFTGFTPMAYRSLAERCWQADPDLRPSFNEILDQLLALRDSYPPSQPIALPAKPPLSPSSFAPLHESAWRPCLLWQGSGPSPPSAPGPLPRPQAGPQAIPSVAHTPRSATAKGPPQARPCPLLPIPEHSDRLVTTAAVEISAAKAELGPGPGPVPAAALGGGSSPCVGAAGAVVVSLKASPGYSA